MMEAIASFMSIQSVIAAVFCGAVVLFIHLIYKFSIKEKSFEEALAEQKQRNIEEEFKKVKPEKSKKDKKFKKTWERKKKDKPENETLPEPQMKEEAVPIIEVDEHVEVKNQKQKSKKNNSVSSTQLPKSLEKDNKSENEVNKSKKQENSAIPKPKKQETEMIEKSKKSDPVVIEKSKKSDATTVDKSKKPNIASTDKSKKLDGHNADNSKKSENKGTEKPKKSEVATNVEKQAKETKKSIQEEKSVKHETTKNKEETDRKKDSSEKKKESVEATLSTNKKKKKEQENYNLSSSIDLVSFIKDAALDTDDIQNLIDVLLNKQKDSDGWSKRNDHAASGKRNTHDKAQTLDQKQNQTIALKFKELSEEHNQLQAKHSAFEKSSNERFDKMQKEASAKINELQELCKIEKEKYNELLKKGAVDNKAQVQQVAIKQEIESHSPSVKAEIESLKKSKDDLQKVHFLLVGEHTNIVSKHISEVKNLNSKISALNKDLEATKARNEPVLKELQSYKTNKATLEQGKKNFEDKFLAEKQRCEELEMQIKELTATKSKDSGHGQDVCQNGILHGQAAQDESLAKSLEEKDMLIKEKETLLTKKDSELNQLKKETDSLKSDVKRLNEDNETQKKKNDELREKNWKAMDALKSSEEKNQQKLKDAASEMDKKISQVQKECAEKLISQKTDSEHTDKMREIETRSEKRLTDYTAEVEKNKTLSSEVERLGAQYKSVESTVSIMEKRVEDLNLQIKGNQSRTRECLQRLYPSVSVDSSLSHDRWVEEFEKLATLSTEVSSTNLSEAELNRVRNEYDEKLLDNQRHMDIVLSNTESTLKELQEKAEAKESMMQEKIKTIESELQKVRSEKDSLSSELHTVQSSLQQLSQLDELQDKLKLLKSTLESTENEKLQLERKYDEVNENCLNLKNQLENKDNEISELKKKQETESLTKEIEYLKSSLEKEKKISRDFSTQMIRLKSLVNIGQDALSAEQESVKKLKQQLDAVQISTANGTTQSPVVQESTPAKGKHSEKSKKKSDVSAKK